MSGNPSKKKMRQKLVTEGAIALLIALSPLFVYMYKYIPQGLETYRILGMEFGANGYTDVYHAFYYYLAKLVPLILMAIWFFNCSKWWYHAILIPLAMYAIQFYMASFSDSGTVDENEVMYIVGLCMIVVPILYLIRIKLVDKYVHGIDLTAMDEELQIYKEKEELRKEREKLELRKKTLSKKM